VNEKIDPDWVPVGSLQNRVVLRRSRWFYAGCVIFAAALTSWAIYFLPRSDNHYVSFFNLLTVPTKWLLWIGIPILIAATLGLLVALFRPPTLTLNREGFEERLIRKTISHKWADVSDFSTTKVSNGRSKTEFVTFYHQKEVGPINKADPDSALNIPPVAGRLSDNFGVKHKELISLMQAFRQRALEESDEPQKPTLAAFAQYSGNETESADWQAANEAGVGYDVNKEQAPWLKWGLSAILLGGVTMAGLWLVSTMYNPENAPKEKIELVTAEPEEPTEPPKSADEQAWIDALEKDTLQGYRDYIEAFPNGRYVDKAQAEIDKYDDKAWAEAERRNTIAGYEDYLTDWPEGKYAPKAQERIDAMKKAIEAQKKDAAERAARERRAWEVAEAGNTVASYQEYLAKYPSGKNAIEAQARIDRMSADAATAQALAIEQAAWSSAKNANTAESYQTYLSSYPNGTYAPLAKAALEELRPSPGKTFQDCNACPMMKTLESGNAQLGAGASEPGVKPNEQPQRPVIISTPFSISLTEVTFAQWDACVTGGGCTKRPKDNGWGRGNRPVINISWDDAQGYAKWLSDQTGKPYSLPSEAQWEYAARGGETGHYMGGSAKALCAFANGAGIESGLTWANKECSDLSSDRTLPVGSLSANKFGIKDMLGNVQEWTLDCNTLNLKDAPTNGNPDLRGSCNQRVVRGGSWFSPPTGLRFTTRENQRRGDSNDFTGFRVVRN